MSGSCFYFNLYTHVQNTGTWCTCSHLCDTLQLVILMIQTTDRSVDMKHTSLVFLILTMPRKMITSMNQPSSQASLSCHDNSTVLDCWFQLWYIQKHWSWIKTVYAWSPAYRISRWNWHGILAFQFHAHIRYQVTSPSWHFLGCWCFHWNSLLVNQNFKDFHSDWQALI